MTLVTMMSLLPRPIAWRRLQRGRNFYTRHRAKTLNTTVPKISRSLGATGPEKHLAPEEHQEISLNV
jgi:hypothetical protein